MDPSSLSHLKHSQLRKPPSKSSLVEPNMTEEEVNMRFIQELLSWVEEMQVRLSHSLSLCVSQRAFHDCTHGVLCCYRLPPQLQLDRSEWGSDLPSVEMHIENHKGVHRAIEEFQLSLKDAKLSEVKNSYSRTT